MCIYIYLCVFVCVYACVCMYLYVYIYVSVCMYVYMLFGHKTSSASKPLPLLNELDARGALS